MHFHSITKLGRGAHKIDVIESVSDMAAGPITRFHSTAVMNYLTANSLVLMYPTLTLKKMSIMQLSVRRGEEEWKPRYEERLYTVISPSSMPAQYWDALFPESGRNTHDHHCLQIPYDSKKARCLDCALMSAPFFIGQ